MKKHGPNYNKKELEEIADRLTDMILDKDCTDEEIRNEIEHSKEVIDMSKK